MHRRDPGERGPSAGYQAAGGIFVNSILHYVEKDVRGGAARVGRRDATHVAVVAIIPPLVAVVVHLRDVVAAVQTAAVVRNAVQIVGRLRLAAVVYRSGDKTYWSAARIS